MDYYVNERLEWEPCPPASMLRRRLPWERRHYDGHRDAGDGLRLLAELPEWPTDAGSEKRLASMHAKFRALANYDVSHGAVLLGPTGCGKTTTQVHIACRLIQRGLEQGRGWPRMRFIKATDLALARRKTPLGEDEAPLVRDAMNAQLLFLDDLGQEHSGTDTAIWETLDHRYDKGRPTIVTSGLTTEQFTERYGEAFTRRILTTRGVEGRIYSAFARPALAVARG